MSDNYQLPCSNIQLRLDHGYLPDFDTNYGLRTHGNYVLMSTSTRIAIVGIIEIGCMDIWFR
jgi:hypothetical protein